MQDKNTSFEGELPEQKLQGFSGPNKEIPDGIYKIYTYLDNTMLIDMSLSGDSNGIHNVKLYRDTNAPESTWILQKATAKFQYYIFNGKSNSKLLQHRYQNLNNIFAATTNPILLDAWVFKDAGNGFFYIKDVDSDGVMDVRGSNTADNTNIIYYRYQGSNNQKFRLVAQ